MKKMIFIIGVVVIAIVVSTLFVVQNKPVAPVVFQSDPVTIDDVTISGDDFVSTHFAAIAGNPDADQVVIWLQGGPSIDIETDVLQAFVGAGGDSGLYVVPFQIQTLYPEQYNTDTITFDQAKTAAAETTRIAHETIAYFKDQGKSVDVVSFSYGSFVAVDQIATYGNTADSYVIAAGRIDIPEQAWSEFAIGNPVGFVDGTDIIPVTIEQAGMGTGTVNGDRNMTRLAAGLGYKRFSELLADTDLSNVSYITAAQDQQVGALSPQEIALIESRGAIVHVVSGSHEDAATAPIFGTLVRGLFGL